MKVLFIHPGNQLNTYQSLSDEFTSIAPPIWTPLLANSIRNKGYSVSIYDANLLGWHDKTASELLSKYKPDLIVMMVYGHQPSGSTHTMPSARRISEDLTAWNGEIPIILGGTHPSALPRETLLSESADYVIQGEGLYTIEGLLKYLDGKENIKNIRGLWYWDKENINSNPPAPLITDLDKELGDYAWDLLPSLDNYRAHNCLCFQDFKDINRSPHVTMYTSLGCPYSCAFCCINAVFGKPGTRCWSLDNVFSWIDKIVERKVKTFRIDDELFFLSKKRVEGFCDMMIDRKYDVNMFCYARIDTIEESILKKMKEAGFNWLAIGIESGNKRVMEGVNKNIGKDVKEVLSKVRHYDINVIGNYILGLPDDNFETMEETLKMAMDLNNEFVNFYSAMAYPGSALWNKSPQNNNWERYSQHGYETVPLSTKYLTSEQVLKFRDEAHLRYFRNPRYLDYIQDKFGIEVREHLERMNQIKLERRILAGEEG